jgi:hypothetical protein
VADEVVRHRPQLPTMLPHKRSSLDSSSKVLHCCLGSASLVVG